MELDGGNEHLDNDITQQSSIIHHDNERNKGIIWDLDGTLCNSFELGYNSTNYILQSHEYSPISPEEYHQGTKYPTKQRLLWHIQQQGVNSLPKVESELEEYGKKLEEEFNSHYINLINPSNTKLYDGMIEILAQYSTIAKMSILSNASTDYVTKVVQTNNIEHYFQLLYGIEDVPHGKPHPSGLQKIIKEYHIQKSCCIYIGDTISDGQAAKECGIYSIGVTWGHSTSESIQDYFSSIVNTPEELLRTIEKYYQTHPCRRKSRSKSVSWQEDVVDNEGMGKLRTDDEYWHPEHRY